MSLYRRKKDGPWYVDIEHAGHRVRRSTGHVDRTKAQEVHNQIQIELWQHVPVLNERSWGEAVLEWCKARPRSESDLLSLKKFARYFPDRGLSAVTPEVVDQALSFCKTDGTYTRYRTTVAAILALAVDNGWLAKMPKLKQRKTKKAKPRDWLTLEQWEKLYLLLPEHQRAPAAFSIETGLRQANVLGLQWKTLDLKRCCAWVEAENAKGNEPIAVPLNERAIKILETVKATCGEVDSDDYVFLYRGKPITDIKTGFQLACIKAGLGHVVKGCYVGFTWHGLRHTWATWHVQSGTPLDVLQKLGAWADLRMVMNYAHHSPGYLSKFADNRRMT